MSPATVRAKRISLHLSQSDVARAVGISRVAITRYEASELQLTDDVLERIGEILGLEILDRVNYHMGRVDSLVQSALAHEAKT
jgi:transcriptional regulator with XRE-family HTH domain